MATTFTVSGFQVSAAIDTFLRSASSAAARTNLGIALTQNGSSALVQTGNFTITLNGVAGVTLTAPGVSGTLATLAGTETFTNKTLTTPVLTTPTISSGGATFNGSISGSLVLRAANTATGTVIIPSGNDTLVNLTSIQTLSNKTLVTPVLGAATATSINGVVLTGTSGNILFNSNITLSLPNDNLAFATLGATNVTFPVSGTLYGTQSNSFTSAQLLVSLTTKTGTGLAVFNTSPTFVTPVLGNATGADLILSGALEADTGSFTSEILTDVFYTNTIQPANSQVYMTAARVDQQIYVVSVNGFATIESSLQMITKGGVLTLTVSTPSSQDGTRITFVSTTAFAHVLSFSGSALQDGVTGGGKTTATFAAFAGASLTVVAYGSSWYVESKNGVTIT